MKLHGLLNVVVALLIILFGFSLILGGRRGGRRFFRLLTSPLGCFAGTGRFLIALVIIAAGLLYVIKPGFFVREPKWYPGIIHVHSTFSDGSDNIAQRAESAKQAGASFIIITDHLDQLDSRDKPPAKAGRIANPKAIDVGTDNYLSTFKNLGVESIVMIPGVEVSNSWGSDSAHTLALGSLDASVCQSLKSTGSQAATIDIINQHSMSVAAHPNCTSKLTFQIRAWEKGRFRSDTSDPNVCANVKGVEFFNDKGPAQTRATLRWYLSLVGKHRDVFVTSGCDSHGWKEPDDLERWERKTWVWTDNPTAEGFLDALAKGRTYASAQGSYITEMNYRPGGVQSVTSTPTFSIKLVLPTGIANAMRGSSAAMYRDGVEVLSSKRTMRSFGRTMEYSWTDTEASPGLHYYLFWVKPYIVTSPIKISVEVSKLP
ncbi:MAG: hypothetical protein NT018_08900 [Armatimonadetes bacterium]|nr:hypothetical protein [Armatimonadota bacterium]